MQHDLKTVLTNTIHALQEIEKLAVLLDHARTRYPEEMGEQWQQVSYWLVVSCQEDLEYWVRDTLEALKRAEGAIDGETIVQ